MGRSLVATLAAVVFTLSLGAPARAAFDPVATVLTAELRTVIGKDERCRSAREMIENVATTAGGDVQVDLDAMRALERCAAQPRLTTETWRSYQDATMLAAAACAFLAARVSQIPEAYTRAIRDASYVTGFRYYAASQFRDVRSATQTGERRPTFVRGGSGVENMSISYRNETVRIPGGVQAGDYAKLSSDLAEAAEKEFDALKSAK